jgi:hypothetical protein
MHEGRNVRVDVCRYTLRTFFASILTLFLLPGSCASAKSKPPSQNTRGHSRENIGTPAPSASAKLTKARLLESYGKLPLSFEANQGQTDPHVKFLSRGRGYELFLTSRQAVLALGTARSTDGGALHGQDKSPEPHKNAASPEVLRMELLGANPSPEISGIDELAGRSNYFLGNDPQKWRTNIPNYAKVLYRDVYPGVDLVYYGNQRQMEYDWVAAPGADLSKIRFSIQGAEGVSANAQGDLVIRLGSGEVELRKPVIYQVVSLGLPASERRYVNGRFVVLAPKAAQRASEEGRSEFAVGFEVAAYDSAKYLILDPTLTYSTYLGGNNDSAALAIVVDPAGNAYVAGGTIATNFPTTAGAYATAFAGAPVSCGAPFTFECGDVFVTKFNSAGTAQVYSTYLGGSDRDFASGIALDSSFNAYITGTTHSTNYPTTAGAFQGTLVANKGAFVTKLDPTGALAYSTYLSSPVVGDYGVDGGGIALNGSNAIVTGDTNSANFPTTSNAYQTSLSSGTCGGSPCHDAFVAEFGSTGALVYSTYLGGNSEDVGRGVAVDSLGRFVVAGATASTNFPTLNAYQPTFGGGGTSCSSSLIVCGDAFVTVINPAISGTSALAYSTYLGGSGEDGAVGVSIGPSDGKIYITGGTDSSNFPVTTGAVQQTFGGGSAGCLTAGLACGDAFVAKLDPTQPGTASLVYSTYLGGTGDDLGLGIAVDTTGNAHVTGLTNAADFPHTADALYSYAGGTNPCSAGAICGDAFVTKLNFSGSVVIYSTFLGGTGDDAGAGIGLDSSGNAYIAGGTGSSPFPTTTGAYSTTCAASCSGGMDAFVAGISGLQLPVATVSPASLTFGSTGVHNTSTGQDVTLSNSGDATLTFTVPFTVTGDFAQAGTSCTGSLAPQDSCTVTVTFTPTASGTRNGNLSISDNAAGTPHTVSLTGTGMPAPIASLSPSIVQFPGQVINTISLSSQTVTLANSGTADLTITNVATTGPFGQTNTCLVPPATSATLAAGASCTIDVTCTPTVVGNNFGTLTVTDDSVDGTQQTADLSGTGFSAGVPSASVSGTSVASLDFGTHPVGTTTSMTATIANSGTGPLGSLSVSINDPQAIPCDPSQFPNCNPQTDGSLPFQFTQTNDCPASLAVGANCTITVTYRALTLGTVGGTLRVANDGATNPLNISLSGTASPVPFAKGEVFLGVGNGKIQRRSATGQLIQVIDAGVTGDIAGMAFDSSGNLYAAAFGDLKIQEFDSNGNLLKTFADLATLGLTDKPESIAFDKAGDVYVGSPDNTYIYEFDASGKLLNQYNVAVGLFGTAWIDIASDQCTIYYTSEDVSIKRYDVCTSTQLPALTNSLTSAYALRIRPNGEVLVADSDSVDRLDASGNSLQTYTPLNTGYLFALNLDPDGTSFWTADLYGTQVYKIDVVTGTQLVQYTVYSPDIGGITVKGEINVATMAPVVTLSPTSIDFGNATLGTTSTVVQPVTLTNSGNDTLTFTSNFTITGANLTDFGITSNTCGTTLAAGSSCGFNVTFTPSAVGARSADVSIADNAADSPQQIPLTGTGVGTPAVTLSATSLVMPDTPLNLTCAPRTLTITNSGTAALAISSVATSDSTVFAISANTCTASLQPGANCAVSVTFHPTVTGTVTGSLTIASNAPGSPQTVVLSGTGKPACPLAAAVVSEQVLRGTDRTVFTVEPNATCQATDQIALACVNAEPATCAFNPGTIQNPQKSLLTMSGLRAISDSIKNFQVTGTSADFIQRTLYLQVLFSDFSFTPYPTQATVAAGGTASYALSIVPVNGLAGQVALSCTGAPAGGSCTVTPSAVNVANEVPVQVHVKVQTSSGGLAPVEMERRPQLPIPGSRLPVFVWILAVLLAVGGCRLLVDGGRRLAPKVRLATGMAMLAAVAMWASCGGGGTSPPLGVERSMRGTYTIVVTGTVAPGTTTGVVTDPSTPPLEHQVKLTLQVQ